MWTDKSERHLTDRELLDRYFAERDAGNAVDAAMPHVAVCAPCQERYQELTGELNLLIDTEVSEAEAIFTPEMLAQQRQHIMRRLESRGRGADIFLFPSRARAVTLRTVPRRSTRWVAAAAAAGLAIGVGLGLSVERLKIDWSPVPSSTVASGPARISPPVVAEPPVDRATPIEDELLAEIDAALASRRAQELTALDALTPEPVNISLRRR
jgi:hypothetical protein